MFTKKHDPVVDSVRKIMEQNDLRRRVADALNEELGISSRNALPHEYRARYDAALEEAYKCAMKEARDFSKDFHIITPDGKKTVMISNSQKDAEGAAGRFGKGYKVYRGDELPSTWEGSGTGSYLFAGKKKLDENEGSTPRNEREANLAALKEPRDKITHADVLKGRGVIKQEEAKIAVGNKPTTTPSKGVPRALEEKAVSKAQHRFFGLVRGIQKGKAHGSKKAEKAAKEMSTKEVRKFAKTKEKGLPEKVDESNSTIRTGANKPIIVEKPKKDKSNLTVKTNRPVKESLESIMEEIRSNLEEQLIAVYESGNEQMFEDFVSSLTEEQLEILGLNEQGGLFGWGGHPGKTARAEQQRDSTDADQGANMRQATQGASVPAPAPAPRNPLNQTPAQALDTYRAQQAARVPTQAPAPTTPAGGARAAAEVVPGEGRRPAPAAPTQAPAPTTPAGGARAAAEVVPGEGRRPAPAAPTQAPAPAASPQRPTTAPRPAAPMRSRTPDLDAPRTAGMSSRRMSDLGFVPESTHIKESLESFIRNKFIKG